MPTTNPPALWKNTATTEALSVSTALPEGCFAYRRGLALRPGLTFDEWKSVGRRLSEMAGAICWLIGDWLAYGISKDQTSGRPEWRKDWPELCRIKGGVYSELATITGLTEQTLRNAKWVCSAVNLSLRGDKLTFSHAEEIVGRSTPGQFEFWISTVERDGLTVQQLRERLRKAKAIHKPEPNDHGVTTPLAITDQYIRDIMPLADDLTPAQSAEHFKNLQPLLEKLAEHLTPAQALSRLAQLRPMLERMSHRAREAA